MRATLALATLILALGGLPAAARTPGRAPTRWHRGLASPPSAAPAPEAALAFLRARGADLGLRGVELAPAGPVRRFRGHAVVRLAQRHEGLPVLDRGVVLRLDGLGRIRTVAATVASRLDVIPLATVSPAEALQATLDHWSAPGLGHVTARLAIRDDGASGELVWQVEGNLPGGRVRTLVDAVTGEVRAAASLARHARGRVYAANPVATPAPVEVELANRTTDATTLEGRAAAVWRYVSGSLGDPENLVLEHLATDDGSGFLFEPHPDDVVYDDPFAEVNLYYHVDRVDAYFREAHGHVPLRRLTVVANYTESPGVPYNNAFSTQLSGTEHGLFFGQGSGVDFGYDGDVVYHEFTHFVVDEVSHMGYLETLFDEQGMHFAPGGLHEGLADYFSSSLADDGVIGEYSMPSSMRPLENDLRCPDDVFGEPHEDGRIVGGVTWAIRETLGASDLADALVFGALTLLSATASFQDFSEALLDTADLLVADGALTQAQRDAIAAILAERGMDRCGRFLDLAPSQPVTTHPFGFDWLSGVAQSDCETIRVLGIWLPGAFQYRVDVPADANTLRIRVEHSPGDRLLYRVILRRAEPVGFSVSPVTQGLNVVFVRHFDHDFGEYEDADHTVTLTTADAEPLVPGSTYYVAFLHQNCPDTEVRIQASTDPALPEPDAGVGPDEDNGKGGCGCAQGRGSGAASGALPLLVLWLALPLALLLRRRRR